MSSHKQRQSGKHSVRPRTLEPSYQCIQQILESITDAFFSLDRNWNFTYVNREAQRLLRKSAAELLGTNIWQDFPNADAFRRRYEDVIAEKKAAHFEEYYAPLATWFEVHAYPTGDGISVYFRNINDRKHAEQALIRAEKLASAGRVAATLAHEINNPLAAIMNALFIVSNERSVPEPVRKLIAVAEREAKRAAQISKRTLGLYQDRGQGTRVAVAEVLDELTAIYESRLRERGIQLQVRVADPAAVVVADAGELRQVVSNLLVNAIDAVGQSGNVYVRVRNHSHVCGTPAIRITVADSGSGIEPQHLKRIFEPFFTTKKDIGTGLGLWISEQIVQKHRGSMRIRSRVGRGTVFSILLPAAMPSGAGTAAGR